MAIYDTDEPAADPDGNKAEGESDDDILSLARQHYRMCEDAEGDRSDAKDDLTFLLGGENQWDPRGLAQRKLDGRPVITVNDLPTFLHQVTNDQRQNRPSIKVHPVDSNADPETAKVIQGLIRHIEYDSNADVCYDRSVNSAAAIGFGFWYLDTEYEGTSDNQKIVYRTIRNHLAVHIDPLAVEADGSDMGFAFIESLMNRKDFEKEYPKAKACDQSVFAGNSDYSGWLSDQTVLVCRYYCIKKTKEDVVLLSNGEHGFKKDLVSMPEGVTVLKTRKGERRKVMLYKITGVDILESTEIKCKWIPVFPVYGDEIDIEGKVNRAGLVRNAKGPCQAYNVMISGATEEVALRTKSPYIGAEGQFEGHEEEWAQANNRAFPFLEYKPTALDGKLTPQPQRQPMADIPTGMLAMAMHAQDNKKKTMGLFDASLGARGTATSGVQEKAQQREGDMANVHYMDGLLRTLRHCGRCIVSMIPNYYDTRRTVRMLGDDDTGSSAEINAPQIEQTEQGPIQTVLNDLSVGEYDITVSAGPSYSTLRQEAAEGMAENMAKNPALWGVIGDLYVKNQDWPGADAMAERIKKTIPPNLIADEAKEDDEANAVIQTPKGPLPVAQVPQVLAGLEQQLMMAGEAVQKSDADKNAAAVLQQQNSQKELEIRGREAETKAFEADTARSKAQAEAEQRRLDAFVQAEKYKAEQLKLRVDEIRARNEDAAEGEQAAMDQAQELAAAQAAAQAEASKPSIEEVAQLLASSKQQISGMTITSPSGQVYKVDVNSQH